LDYDVGGGKGGLGEGGDNGANGMKFEEGEICAGKPKVGGVIPGGGGHAGGSATAFGGGTNSTVSVSCGSVVGYWDAEGNCKIAIDKDTIKAGADPKKAVGKINGQDV